MFGADSGLVFIGKMALLAYATWKIIKWIWWLQDRFAEHKAARKAKATARTGHTGEPVVQGKLPKGTFQ